MPNHLKLLNTSSKIASALKHWDIPTGPMKHPNKPDSMVLNWNYKIKTAQCVQGTGLQTWRRRKQDVLETSLNNHGLKTYLGDSWVISCNQKQAEAGGLLRLNGPKHRPHIYIHDSLFLSKNVFVHRATHWNHTLVRFSGAILVKTFFFTKFLGTDCCDAASCSKVSGLTCLLFGGGICRHTLSHAM